MSGESGYMMRPEIFSFHMKKNKYFAIFISVKHEFRISGIDIGIEKKRVDFKILNLYKFGVFNDITIVRPPQL